MSENGETGALISKSFPVFDCDAHVNDPEEIWSKYVPESQKELVQNADDGALPGKAG